MIDNTPNLQSIKVKNKYLAVFFEPGILIENGRTIISTNQACALIAKKEKGHWHLWIADPTGKQTIINLTLENTRKIQVILPTGALRGFIKELIL